MNYVPRKMTENPRPPRPPFRDLQTNRSPSASTAAEGPRRLQRMGAVTVGVSLPRQWVGERGLTAGSAIHLRALPDGSLLLRDGLVSTPRGRAWVVAGPETAPEHLFRELVGAYLGGAAEFALHQPGGLSEATRSVARLFARRTIQPELASEDASTLILKDVSLGPGLPVPRLLDRMFHLVLDLHHAAGRTWESARPAPGDALGLEDDAVDRYAWLIERVLTLRISADGGVAGRGGSDDDPLQTLLLTRALERVADHAVSLGEHGARLADAAIPRTAASALTGYHQQSLEHLRSAVEVAEHPDAARANEVIDAGEALHATQTALTDAFLVRGSLAALPPMAIAALGLALESIDRTVAYAQDIAQVGLDRAAWARVSRRAPLDPGVPPGPTPLAGPPALRFRP